MGSSQRAVGVALFVVLILTIGCGRSTSPQAAQQTVAGDALNVSVSIVPQKYFLERIGGEHVAVNVMVEPGDSPHTYEPKPAQLRALSLAAAYFSIGVEFEHAWLGRITSANPNMLMVDTTRGIERMPMVADHDHEQAAEQPQGEGENLDPHIWLSPRLVKIQARAIYEALVGLDPERSAVYGANLDAFLADIDGLDADIREMLEGLENRKFMVFHPTWGYFARDYGLEMVPVEVGGQEPSAAELASLVDEARREGIKVIFAQPELSTRAADTIAAEIGGRVLLISPLAENWLDNLREAASTFAMVLG